MAFLKLNGWEIPIADRQASRSAYDIGLTKTGFMGDGIYNTITNKRSWKFTTTPLEEADAVALENMLIGSGGHWDFENDFWAVKSGWWELSGFQGSLIAAPVKFGSRCLYVLNSQDWWADSSAFLNYDYTISVWCYYTAAWHHLVITYDGDTSTTTKYIDNSSGATINNIAISNYDVNLQGEIPNGAKANTPWDDLVIVPYVMTTDQITAIYNSGTGLEYSDLPFLNMSGDVIKQTSAIEVFGVLEDEGYLQASIDGSWNDNLRSVSFSLIEA